MMGTNNAATNISARVLNLIILLRVDEHAMMMMMTIPADLQVLSPKCSAQPCTQ